jgi:hypothetical protein
LGKGSSIIFIFRLPIHAAARPFSVVMLRTNRLGRHLGNIWFYRRRRCRDGG